MQQPVATRMSTLAFDSSIVWTWRRYSMSIQPNNSKLTLSWWLGWSSVPLRWFLAWATSGGHRNGKYHSVSKRKTIWQHEKASWPKLQPLWKNELATWTRLYNERCLKTKRTRTSLLWPQARAWGKTKPSRRLTTNKIQVTNPITQVKKLPDYRNHAWLCSRRITFHLLVSCPALSAASDLAISDPRLKKKAVWFNIQPRNWNMWTSSMKPFWLTDE